MHTSSGSNSSAKESDLQAENERLRIELATANATLSTYRRGYSFITRFASTVAYGPGLARALEAWDIAHKKSPNQLFFRKIPRQETMDLLGAYLRRRAVSGLLIAVIVTIPAAVTMVLLWKQNSKIDQQILLTAAAQANQLQSEITQTSRALFASGKEICLPATENFERAVASFFKSSDNRLVAATLNEVLCWNQLTNRSDIERAAWLRLREANVTTSHDNLIKMIPKPGGEVNPAWVASLGKPPPPRELQVQAITLSEALRPYRSLQEDTDTDAAPKLAVSVSSPERGALIKAFAAAQLATGPANFSRAWAPGEDLSGASLKQANLTNAFIQCSTIRGSLEGANLTRIRASGTNFGSTDLREVRSLAGADMRFAILNDAFLPGASQLQNTDLRGATFGGAIAPEENWLKSATGAAFKEHPPYKYTRVISSLGMPTNFWVMENTSDSGPLQAAQAKHCEAQRQALYAE